jgi:hypothetical protein
MCRFLVHSSGRYPGKKGIRYKISPSNYNGSSQTSFPVTIYSLLHIRLLINYPAERWMLK